MVLSVVILVVMLVDVGQAQAKFNADAVYRGDKRQEIADVRDPAVLRAADATVSMFMAQKLKRSGEAYLFDTTPMSQAMGICADEKFADQSSASECSGVLIDSNRVLTAGHCVSKKSCTDSAFVFGYAINGAKQRPSHFPVSSVFFCKRVLARSNTESLDFAVVELDRAVTDHVPARISTRRADVGEDVYLLSHPAGVPLKYSPPSHVEHATKNRFIAEIDALGGSSGGAVFSARTNELVGILVAGEKDYFKDKKNGCRRIYKCGPGQCDGEESTQAAEILEKLPLSNFPLVND